MKRAKIFLLLIAVLPGSTLAQATDARAHRDISLEAMSVSRFERRLELCGVDQSSRTTIATRLYDWLSYLRCGTSHEDKNCDATAFLATELICANMVPCANREPPETSIDCAPFLTRYHSMKIGRPDWKVTDGLN